MILPFVSVFESLSFAAGGALFDPAGEGVERSVLRYYTTFVWDSATGAIRAYSRAGWFVNAVRAALHSDGPAYFFHEQS